mgnify:CR=1 FL=1|tara:strand:- start:211 stop:1338 length:1128 start_codon:yes stop_codon:yes gene_type:complete
MPRSSGTYTAPSNSWNPAVVSTTIDQDHWNTLLTDLEAALSASIANDGQTATTASIPFASGITADTIGEISGSGNGVTIDGVLLKDGRVDMAKGGDIASATTTDIGASTGNFIDITGTTTITGFGTIAAGAIRFLQFDGILTLTHNATSLILPTGANIATATGDVAGFVSLGSGNWKCIYYQRADGAPLVAASANSIDGTMIAIGSDAIGDIMYYDGTDWVILAAGTDGHHLRAQGAAAPIWEAPAAQANQAAIEAETNEDTYIPPDLLKHHPGIAKVWGRITDSGGTPSIGGSYNVGSITDGAAGETTITLTTAFSDTNYSVVATVEEDALSSQGNASIERDTKAAGSFVIFTRNFTPTALDKDVNFSAFGDQA